MCYSLKENTHVVSHIILRCLASQERMFLSKCVYTIYNGVMLICVLTDVLQDPYTHHELGTTVTIGHKVSSYTGPFLV